MSDKQWLRLQEGVATNPSHPSPLARYVSQNGITFGGLRCNISFKTLFYLQEIKLPIICSSQDSNFPSFKGVTLLHCPSSIVHGGTSTVFYMIEQFDNMGVRAHFST